MDDVVREESEEQGKHEEEEEFGGRKTTRKHDPRQPSDQESIETGMTHLPFRNWCRHCMHQGKWTRGGLSQIS